MLRSYDMELGIPHVILAVVFSPLFSINQIFAAATANSSALDGPRSSPSAPGQSWPIPNTPNHVSWQSAFWTLLPLAVNSITQPGGMLCGFPSHLRFYMRSSPIVCAVDGIAVAYEFLAFLVGGLNIRTAAHSVAASRFGDVSGSSNVHGPQKEDGLRNFKRSTLARYALFVLGALPQFLKLCSMRGIPWTTLWGSLFLFSWLIIELVVVSARSCTSAENVSRERIMSLDQRRTFGWLALVAQISVSLGVNEVAIRATVENFTQTLTGRIVAFVILLPWMMVMAVPYGVLPAACLSAIIGVFAPKAKEIVLPIFTAIFGIAAFIWWSYIIFIPTKRDLSLTAFYLFLPMSVMFILGYLASRKSFETPLISHILGVIFFLMNLAAALLYYALSYSPDGTYRPSSTRIFG